MIREVIAKEKEVSAALYIFLICLFEVLIEFYRHSEHNFLKVKIDHTRTYIHHYLKLNLT